MAEFPLTIPLHFVYGTADWVRGVTDSSLPREADGEDGGSVAANVLEGRRARAAKEAGNAATACGDAGVVGSLQVTHAYPAPDPTPNSLPPPSLSPPSLTLTLTLAPCRSWSVGRII